MFTKLDNFIIERFETTIQFLNDWLGITQSWIEKMTIAAYVLTVSVTFTVAMIAPKKVIPNRPAVFDGFLIAVLLMTFIWVFFLLLKQHRMPTATRRVMRTEKLFQRMNWLFWTVWNGTLGTRGNTTVAMWIVSIGVILFYGLIAAMSYEIVCNIEGDRARKAKLAWDKIKELFGTQWLPVPVRQQ